MAQTRYALTLERVAEILDEDLELIATIVAMTTICPAAASFMLRWQQATTASKR